MTSSQTAQAKSTLVAPISGIIVPITDVPDPTFAEKMLGDGIAIDPIEETLRAPAAGTITQFHSSSHALTLTTPDGIEILMHIGLDTVLLKGKGFTGRVKEGDKVTVGDPLIDFDAEYLAKAAASLLIITIITGGGDISGFPTLKGMATAGKTPILNLAAEAAAGAAAAAGEDMKKSAPIVILNPVGLHARPAGVLANSAKQFTSAISLFKGEKEANAKSLTSLMRLEVGNGDSVVVGARGPDADEALAKLVPLIKSGLGEDLTGARPKQPPTPPPAPPKPVSADPNVLLGVSASPGIVTGTVFQLRHAEVTVEKTGRGVETERAAFLAALDNARKELESLKSSLSDRKDSAKAAIFAAHEELLEDPELLCIAQEGIDRGESAAFAWKAAFTQQADTLATLNNELLAGRANDIRDVGRRVLLLLTGQEKKAVDIPANVVLIAKNLTPSDTAGLDKTKVLGFATTEGSATSHVAILARAATIPAIAAVEERVLDIPNHTTVILDGGKGEIRLNPSQADIDRVHAIQTELSIRRKADLADAMKPATTVDGHRVKVVGNIGGDAEANEIPDLGGEGVGLLRSEFLFLQRSDAPSVDEQAAVYTTIAKTIGPDRDLVVRTLDVGGDKPLPYLPLPAEDNPFLGVRGIRLNLVDKGLLSTQVRAVLAAAPFTHLAIMFPMVATVEELREAKAIVMEEKTRQGITAKVEVGMMVEVPSAAVLAENLAAEADFFSIGTNDLTQYTLAVDRGNPRLAKMADALHPAVLGLIAQTVKGAHKHGRWVGVCGGLASELLAVPVLLGLGVDELSVTVSTIPSIKAAVRRQTLTRCQTLAEEILGMLTTAEVRDRLEKFQAEA